MSGRSKAAAADDLLPDGEPASIVRRAPFANSPFVGERGQKAQNRILEAALEVFGDVGYHGCGVKRITELSGYSRASFYQYFSSKEDLFRHLAGRVARELTVSSAALEPITADHDGWESIHQWLLRYAGIYDTYEAVFVTFQTAVVSDEMVASGSSVVLDRNFQGLRSRITGATIPPAQVDTVVRTLLQTVARLNRESEVLALAAPRTSLDRERSIVAFADVFHRALFGPDPAVNVHTSTKRVKPLVQPDALAAGFDVDGDPTHGPAARRTRVQLLEAGHGVFIERGYYATRVADIVKAAGVSHGVFYRYFENKTHLFRILAEQASLQLTEALQSLPSPFGAGDDAPEELRDWLRRYGDTHAANAAIFAMWTEAISRDEELAEVSAALIDGSRSQLARYLEPRGWGDFEADALVLLVFLDAMTGNHPPTAKRIEDSARMIERGLLTGPTTARATKKKGAKRTVKKAATKATRGTVTTLASDDAGRSTNGSGAKTAAATPTARTTAGATGRSRPKAAKAAKAAKPPTATTTR